MRLLDRNQHLEKSQKIYFNKAGIILHSCNSIFSIQDFLDKNIRDFFPLVDSIFDSIINLSNSDFPFQIPKIITTFPNLKGFYDFVFDKVIFKGQELILLTIKDFTKFYTRVKNEMQKQNEVEIRKK